MTFRKFLFWTHLIVGITSGVVILVKSVTGAVLSFEHQIVDWVEKDLQYVTPPIDGQKISFNALLAKAQENQSQSKPSGLNVKSDPTASVLVNFGRASSLYMNPYTGEALGPRSGVERFMHLTEEIHRYFNFKPVGRPISGAATLGFFLLSLSGIYIWWPSTWTKSKVKGITLFNGKLAGKARDWNWHNVIGFWSLPLVIVISLTGVVMSYQWANDLVYRMTGNEPPPPQQQPIRDGGTPDVTVEEPVLNVDAFYARAIEQSPEWYSINFRFPQKPGGPVNATIQETNWTSGIPRRSQLTLDADTAEVKKWEPFEELNRGRKARLWMRYSHSGEAAGWIGQLLGFIVCIGAALLVWTGFSLSWRRYKNWRKSK